MSENPRIVYEPQGEWQYGECEVIERPSGTKITLTQRKNLIEEDMYSIKRFVAVPHDGKKDFYLYEVSVLDNEKGVTINRTLIVLEDKLSIFLKEHLIDVLRGRGLRAVTDFVRGGTA